MNHLEQLDRSNESGYSEAYLRTKFIETMQTETTAVLWTMGNVVPEDIVLDFVKFGLYPASVIVPTNTARNEKFASFLTEYTENQNNRSAADRREEAFELRAVFGPSEKVVNVFTGKVTRT